MCKLFNKYYIFLAKIYLIISQIYCFTKKIWKNVICQVFFIFLFLLRGHIEVIYLNCFSGDDVHPPLCLRLSSAQYIFFSFSFDRISGNGTPHPGVKSISQNQTPTSPVHRFNSSATSTPESKLDRLATRLMQMIFNVNYNSVKLLFWRNFQMHKSKYMSFT